MSGVRWSREEVVKEFKKEHKETTKSIRPIGPDEAICGKLQCVIRKWEAYDSKREGSSPPTTPPALARRKGRKTMHE